MAPPTDSPLTALVIEDDVDTRNLLCKCLKVEGVDPTQVAGGDEALLHLETRPAPSIIFLDWTVPGLGGAEFIAKLRAKSGFESVPVILLSGWHDLEKKTKQSGATSFLKKPFCLEQLSKVIEEFAL